MSTHVIVQYAYSFCSKQFKNIQKTVYDTETEETSLKTQACQPCCLFICPHQSPENIILGTCTTLASTRWGWKTPVTFTLVLFLFFWPCCIWDLSFPTRDRTGTPCIGSTESSPLDHISLEKSQH